MDHRTELVEVIRRIRNRWRMRLAVRGAVIVFVGTVGALLLSASSLEALRFSTVAIVTFRLIAFAVFGALVVYGLVLPLRRRVDDSQVALYLEEHNPSLEAAILSAVEATTGAPKEAHSPHLVEGLVQQAIEQSRAVEHGLAIDRKRLRHLGMTFGTAAVALALLLMLGPAYIRHGLSALLVISRSAEAASPYKIEVLPGNAKVPRGGDQQVRAKLVGFTSKDVSLMMKSGADGQFERMPLVGTADATSFEGIMFHLDKPTEYFIESNGVHSATFSLEVLDLPTVAQLDLEYRFPAYTALPPRKVDTGGDVAALRGTDVVLHIVPTMKTPGGQILFKEGGSAPLTLLADGSLTGTFKMQTPGFYNIELTGPHGEKVNASPQYTIDVLDDQAPTVTFSKPGRDTQASAVEEVFAEVKADDDFGIKQLQLVYAVNGGAPKTVMLFGPGGKPLPNVSAGHTIYLEEMGLKPGDFVSYFAKATDNDGVKGPKTSSSDIYFVQIRPFKKDYKPAQSQAQGQQGGGGGGGQQDVGQLSQQQREIVAATFNVVRDKDKLKADKYRENVVFLNLAQAKLRDQVEELVGKLEARLGAIGGNGPFGEIAAMLPKAAAEMKLAETQLKAMNPNEALAPEQRALKILQDAEAKYETQVTAQQQGGGGGQGGQQQNAAAEDLADLFELEVDKLASQYELKKQAQQQQEDRQVDQLAEKLKELARRQQQEAERQRRLAQQGQQGGQQSGNNSANAQRQLADEAREAARRLEQLSREQQRPELADAARQLQQAADQMQQAAANGQNTGAATQNAIDKLKEAQQKLEREQQGRSDRDIQSALNNARELAKEQKEVQSDVAGLEGQAGAGRQQRAQQLGQRKDQMDAKVGELQKDLEKLANDTRRDEKDASRKLDEAANSIRDRKVREKIRYSKSTLQGAGSEAARGMEDDISANLDSLAQKIGEAAGAMGQQGKQNQLTRAAETAGEARLRPVARLSSRSRCALSARASMPPNSRSASQWRSGRRPANHCRRG